MTMNEWNNMLQTLKSASAETLNRLTDKDLYQVEVILDHWHKMARGARSARLEKEAKIA